jgi:hypothetical protein
MPGKCWTCGSESCYDSICRVLNEEAANHRAHRDALKETLGIDIDKVVPKTWSPEEIEREEQLRREAYVRIWGREPYPAGSGYLPYRPNEGDERVDLELDLGLRRDIFTGEVR